MLYFSQYNLQQELALSLRDTSSLYDQNQNMD